MVGQWVGTLLLLCDSSVTCLCLPHPSPSLSSDQTPLHLLRPMAVIQAAQTLSVFSVVTGEWSERRDGAGVHFYPVADGETVGKERLGKTCVFLPRFLQF